MANELRDAARAALAAIAADSATADSAVTVISNGQKATGIKGVDLKATSPELIGEFGLTTNLVRVSAGSIDPPVRGATLLVNGEKMFAGQSRLDPIGANLVIEYSEQQIYED